MKRIDSPEMLREIESISIRGSCKFQITQFGMRGGRLGDLQIAWAKTKILGHDALIVATKDAAGAEKLSVKLSGEDAPRLPIRPLGA